VEGRCDAENFSCHLDANVGTVSHSETCRDFNKLTHLSRYPPYCLYQPLGQSAPVTSK
jgi:hypothetical protein